MTTLSLPVLWGVGLLMVLSSLGVILFKKPVHSALSFLLTLLMLAILYLELSAEFISVMQVLVYAGAILVLFMFVLILFQDAHQQISRYDRKSNRLLLLTGLVSFLTAFFFLGWEFLTIRAQGGSLPAGYGTAEGLGKTLYLDFFFPFEAVVFVFLLALVGAVYVGRKVN